MSRNAKRTSPAWWRWYDENNPSASEPLHEAMLRCQRWLDGLTDDGPPVESEATAPKKASRATKPVKTKKPKGVRRLMVTLMVDVEVRDAFGMSDSGTTNVVAASFDVLSRGALHDELRSQLACESRGRLSLRDIRSHVVTLAAVQPSALTAVKP